FLGYEISIAGTNRRTRRPSGTDRRNRRSLNGTVVLHVPPSVIKAKSAPYLSRGKPACRNFLVNETDHVIVGKFAAEYRGVVQYYLLAGDVFRLHRLCWVMETSMLRTLARKHGSTVSKMAARFKAKIQTPYGPRTCFEARMVRDSRKELVARFGGIPLKRQKTAELTDRLTGPVYPHKELISRLLANRCEVCEEPGEVEVHHIRSLNDLNRLGEPSSEWVKLMVRRRRKALVVCGSCHGRIHPERSAALTQ
ncbi:maturase, partial [Streptomyces sp. BE20]|uniref:group II intron reverse transcriptase/maturase n=1 Tax=Streptomyces sp. BE20 TaxID=3002525 RepID=UPI002E7633A6